MAKEKGLLRQKWFWALVLILGPWKMPVTMAQGGVQLHPGDYPFKYHMPFVENSAPLFQVGEAHLWMDGEPLNATQACGDPVDGSTLAAASWYYPCHSHIRVYSLKTGRSVTVEITDRGPDLMLFPNNIIDLTPAAANAIGHESSDWILVHPWF